jgi:hypothetical protein
MGRHKYSDRPIIEELENFSIGLLSPILKVYFDKNSLFNQHLDALPGFDQIKISMTSDPSIAFLDGTYQGKEIRVCVEAVHCPYGSFRFYFLCGLTGHRVTRLYLNREGIFLSRFALEAVYRTQREHKGVFSLLSRARDLRNRALSYEGQGRKKRAKDLIKIAGDFEQKFYREKILFFEKRSRRIHERYNY